MKNENQASAAKQKYQAPVLSELGDVSVLTQTGANSNLDGGVGSVA